MQKLSGLSTSRLPTVLTAVALVLAVVGVSGAVSGAADKPSNKVSTATGSTTTTSVATTLVPGATVVTSAGTITGPATTIGKSTATTAKAGSAGDCPTPPAASADPGASAAPAVGTYTYVACTDASDAKEMKVEPVQNDSTRRLISQDAGGYPQTATMLYGPNGVLQESFTIAGVVTCDWKPDVLEWPSSVTTGTTWSADSKCTITSPMGTGELHLTASAKVMGRVQVSVAGTSVNAWVIDSTVHLHSHSTSKQGTRDDDIDIVATNYYDPTRGIDLYRHTTQKSADGQVVTSERLKSLTPAKNA